MIRLLVLLLSTAAASARAEDQYASLKPIIGTWLVERDCGGNKARFTVVVKRLPKGIVAEFLAPREPELNAGRANIFSTGEEDHYRVITALPNNPVLAQLGVTSLSGSVVVSTEDEEEELPNNYITCSSRVSMITSLVTIKLRDRYRTATFLFNTESPLGRQTCRGTGVKQPAVKKKQP